MPHQLLNSTNIVATLEQMRGKAMTKGVWTDRFCNRSCQRGTSITGPNGQTANVLSAWIILTGEEVPRFVTASPED